MTVCKCPRCGSPMTKTTSSFSINGFTDKEQEEIRNKDMHDYRCSYCVEILHYGYFLYFHGKWYNYHGRWNLFDERDKKEKVQFT